MSIGELAALYKRGDLNISPAYQRMFRWDIEQQSALIESIIFANSYSSDLRISIRRWKMESYRWSTAFINNI